VARYCRFFVSGYFVAIAMHATRCPADLKTEVLIKAPALIQRENDSNDWQNAHRIGSWNNCCCCEQTKNKATEV